jgi:hypothetical protein
MARARNIKPSFFMNDELAECGVYAQLLFAGLWCLADREGRLKDRPARIKAEVMPYYDVDVDEQLSILADAKFIIRYEKEQSYIQIVTFEKHQNPHVKEAGSNIPAPDEPGASTVQAPEKHSSSPADSLNRIPDSLKNPMSDANAPDNAAQKKTVCKIPLIDKTEFEVTEDQAAEFQDCYPAIDVPAELRAIRAWNIANPKNRKTRAGVLRHVNAWLGKEQNKARSGNETSRRGSSGNGSGVVYGETPADRNKAASERYFRERGGEVVAAND